MREYGKISPGFWNGETGRRLRGDPEAQVIAFYLVTCPSATMTGVYYLALPTLAHETGMTLQGASKALRRVCDSGFAAYEGDLEVVFVYEMARYQIADQMKPGDKRIIAVSKEIERFRKTPFYNDFYQRYSADFHLPRPSPFEGPSKPLRSQDQDQEQDQEQEQEQESTPAPASPSPAFDFEAVYALYPKKIGYRKGLQRCKSQIKTREKYDALLRAVGNYAAVAQAPFIKQFDTFMGCWEDFVTVQPSLLPRQVKTVGYAPAPSGHNEETTDDTHKL